MRDVISTGRAPKAIGPYSQAIRTAGFVFTSGQVAIDPDTLRGRARAHGAREPPRPFVVPDRAIYRKANRMRETRLRQFQHNRETT